MACVQTRGRTRAKSSPVAGTASVLLMSAVNFAIQSDFRWLLVAPPIVWTFGLLVLAVAAAQR